MATVSKSPVVERTWQKRHASFVARKAFCSSLIILLLLLFVYLDRSCGTIVSLLDIDHWLWYSFETVAGLFLCVKLGLNVLTLVVFLWCYVFGGTVDVTDRQRKLLAVQDNEHGFRTPPPAAQVAATSPEASLIFSTSQGSFSSGDGSPLGSGLGSPVMRSMSPGYSSFKSASPAHYHHLAPYSPSNPLSTSLGRSFDVRHSLNTSAPSPYDQADSSFRSRRSYSQPRSTSSSPYERIRDQGTLHSFLQEQEEKELRSKQAEESVSLNQSSFWSYGASALDLTYTLRKYAYQLASHLPQSTKKTSSDHSASMAGVDQVWKKYSVTEDDLYKWTEKLRKWLSSTIVCRLNQEIQQVNKQLLRIGCDDMQVGEMSLGTLKQLSLTKGGVVPSLHSLLPYLDFSANQEYLARRITDLSTGSMSQFAWNKGGNYGKPWAEHLVTDASLVMHLLCTYLDSRLPAQPRHMDGKVFTSEHFVKTPDKPNAQNKDNLLIYQTGINPPHFQVVIGTQTYNLPKGRNNMFQAILLFFYHVKTKEQGMLGRINLGLSGLNLLWIFD